MDTSSIAFVEKDVCDGSAWSLKWGTLILYREGFVFYYNRQRKENPGRMQDTIQIGDVTEVSVEKFDWLVSKIFWVGRRPVRIRTREGEKTYYIRKTGDLFSALKLVKPSTRITAQNR